MQLLTCGSHNKVKLWDLSRGQIINEWLSGSIGTHTVAISHNGKTAVSGSGDSSLSIWNLN